MVKKMGSFFKSNSRILILLAFFILTIGLVTAIHGGNKKEKLTSSSGKNYPLLDTREKEKNKLN